MKKLSNYKLFGGLIFVLFTSFSSFGQISASNIFSLRIKGGMNLSSVRTDLFNNGINAIVNESKNNQIGWVGGVSARIGKTLFFQPELLVSQKGGSFSSKINLASVATNKVFDLKYTTLDVPLLIGYKKGIVYILGGPVASYSMSENSAIKEAVKSYYNAWEEKRGLNKTNFGFQVGGGIQILGISLDIRYESSLKNIIDESKLPTGVKLDSRQSLVQATLGFNII